MPNAVLGGQNVFWCEQGQGRRAAAFVHCSLASARALRPLMTALQDDHRMMAFDLPGHGGSDAPIAGVDIQDQSLTILSQLIEAQADGPVDLVGHFFGATVCARLAVERPELVRSLVLFEPVFIAILSDLGWPEFTQELEDTRDFYAALEAEDWMAAAANFISRWGLPGEWAKLPIEGRQKVAQRMFLIALNNKAVIKTGPDRMQATDLRTITCPTAVAHGSESPSVMRAISRAVTTLIPSSTETQIAGAGHMLAITHVPECASIVRSVWAR